MNSTMAVNWLPGRRRTPTNIFVLCTGRCGSVTFATASSHLTNYTAGHETRASYILAPRFAYPANHIEADNRLAWLLGGLGRRFDDENVLYVHLQRDREAVARSYASRWDSSFKASMIRAFGHGIVMRKAEYSPRARIEVAQYYVDTVTANIQEFLRHRPSMNAQLETIDEDYANFLDRVGAEGDLDAARAEWHVRHNASSKLIDAPPDATES